MVGRGFSHPQSEGLLCRYLKIERRRGRENALDRFLVTSQLLLLEVTPLVAPFQDKALMMPLFYGEGGENTLMRVRENSDCK